MMKHVEVPRPYSKEQASLGRSSERKSPLTIPPDVIVVGASTGGPQALDVLLHGLAPFITNVHVFVVLHTLAELMGMVTQHVASLTSLPVETACDHAIARTGTIYFAPGNRHLGLVRHGIDTEMFLSDAPPEHYCRPSVDFLFRSAAQHFAPRVLGIVLSGMGNDGLDGSRAIVESGGDVIAQDKATSVVWGMPGSVAEEHLAAAILPVDLIAPEVGALLTRTAGGSLRGL